MTDVEQPNSPSGSAPPRRPHARTSAIHKALLTGLLGSIGVRTDDRKKIEAGDYLGPRGLRFSIAPGSALHRKTAPWVMAAEIVQTNRFLARTVAKTHSDWLERAAAHLVTRTFFEPHWVRESGQVAAYEKVTLQGLVLVPKRRVPYGPIDPKAAHEIFIQNALVEGEIRSDAPFLRANRRLLGELAELEARARRRDLRPDPRIIFAFYDARIPADIHSTPAFEKWRSQTERTNSMLLHMTRADLLADAARDINADHFPGSVDLGGVVLPIEYRYEPGTPDDGATVRIPMDLLQRLSPDAADWFIPGSRRELVTAMLKSLPKRLRAALLPINDVVDSILRDLNPGSITLREALSRAVHRTTGIPVAAADWNASLLPEHLRFNFVIVDSNEAVLERGRDLRSLQHSLADLKPTPPIASATAATNASANDSRLRPLEREGIITWDFGSLPDSVEITQAGARAIAYPGLVDRGSTVSITRFDSPAAAKASSRLGARRLFALAVKGEIDQLIDFLPDIDDLTMRFTPLGTGPEFRAALRDLVADRAFLNFDEDIATAADFDQRLAAGWNRLWVATEEVRELVDSILDSWNHLALMLGGLVPPALARTYGEVQEQMNRLFAPGFLTATPWYRLRHVPRYLAAAMTRLRKLGGGGLDRDQRSGAEFAVQWNRFLAREADHERRGIHDEALKEFRWLLEEFRVHLFAQELRTPIPVSTKRLDEAWSRIRT